MGKQYRKIHRSQVLIYSTLLLFQTGLVGSKPAPLQSQDTNTSESGISH